MKRNLKRTLALTLIYAITAILLLSQVIPQGASTGPWSFPPWSFGLNFREHFSFGSALDGNDDVLMDNSTTPTTLTTPNGASAIVNYVTTAPGLILDRDGGVDIRLAGIHLTFSPVITLSITLPSPGTYDFTLALGDAAAAQPTSTITVNDNGSPVLTVSAAGLVTNWVDANGNFYQNAVWPGSNTPKSLVFTTTTCTLVFGNGVTTTTWGHIHFRRTA